VRTELSWTHYRIISRLETESLRFQYVKLAVEGNWDTRSLQRNIRTKYIDRILEPGTEGTIMPETVLKDPYIFEFLGLSIDSEQTENTIETALINLCLVFTLSDPIMN
jgi:predicted nuclease of restriction endonuclease-like (RecB) superfamily